MKTQKNTQKHKKRKEKIMNTIKSRNLRAIGIIGVLALTLTSPIQAQDNETTFPSYIPIAGQPEGVTVDKIGNVYVSVRASTDQIWKLSPSGVRTLLADLGEPGGGVCGLAVDTVGNVYAARAHEPGRVIDPNLDNPGVYRIDPNGDVVLLPGTGQIVFPNGLAFDHRGTLYVTETYSIESSSGDFGPGGIWRIPEGGTAELWLRDELLTGLPPSLFPFPLGANGIGFYHGDLYMINSDKALVVRVRVRPDGSPGQPEVWKEVEEVPESVFYNSPIFPVMLDGLAFDVHGNIYITVISRIAVVRINADDSSQETIAVYPEIPLDSPASLAFGTGKGGRQNLFVTNLGIMGGFVPEMEWPGPGLVKLERRCAWFAAAMNMR
jgi:sugar lactone lactonase YvrE